MAAREFQEEEEAAVAAEVGGTADTMAMMLMEMGMDWGTVEAI